MPCVCGDDCCTYCGCSAEVDEHDVDWDELEVPC